MKAAVADSDIKQLWINGFEPFTSELNGSDLQGFRPVRKAAMEAFSESGFPTNKDEEWKYTSVKPLLEQGFSPMMQQKGALEGKIHPVLLPEKESWSIVFVNGWFSEELSHLPPADEMILMPLSVAFVKHGDLVTRYLGQSAEYADQPFTALNTAYAREGLFLYLPDNTVATKPVELIHIMDTSKDQAVAQPRNLIIAGKHSQASVITTSSTTGNHTSFINSVTEIYAEDGANLKYYRLQKDNQLSYLVDRTKVIQKRDSSVENLTFTTGHKWIRNDLDIQLDGPGAFSKLYGLYMLNGDQHVDNHTLVDHAVPDCLSDELYKGILGGHSTGVFNGKVLVRQDAQRTNAFQSNKNILLSDQARINTKPQLEIFADDVKCSHGATTGRLDEEALFYLRARGISKDAAMAILTRAFANDIVEITEIETLREILTGLVERRLTH